MEPLTFENLTRNPEILVALHQRARRERAEAIHRLMVAPIKALFTLEYALHPRSAHVQGRPAKG